MKSNSVCVTFAITLLFLASFVSSSDPSSDYTLVAHYDFPEHKVVLYDIRGTLVITCNVTKKTVNSEKVEMFWYKDGVELNDHEKRVHISEKTEGKETVYKLSMGRATIEDVGNYTCKIKDEDLVDLLSQEIVVGTRPFVKLVPNTSVVEGETLTLHCNVHGKPTPIVYWTVGNETYEESADRVILEDDTETGIQKAKLIMKDITLADRNEYACMARTNYTSLDLDHDSKAITYVRVKDKLAALWPFLGICAEVFVLCAIILIYEKKRNKTELEESDTDQSPDQKNTPDNGKESDVRHRK